MNACEIACALKTHAHPPALWFALIQWKGVMPDRYFASEPIAGEVARLSDEDAHHLMHVMRARPGQEVIVFDGSGAEWLAAVTRLERSTVELRLLDRREVDRELPIELTLMVALPKGDRQRWLVEKAVELGVSRLVPLTTERGVAQPVEKALARLRRTVIEASKQCGRNRLMKIAVPLTAAEAFSAPRVDGALRASLDPSGRQSLQALLAGDGAGKPRSICFAIGPEGGFSGDELRLAEANQWPVVHLGPRILRVETAALCAAAGAQMLGCESLYSAREGLAETPSIK